MQEAEQEEVKVIADTQPPRSAKKGKASASSTPQMGSDKKERKGKHKGDRVKNRSRWNEWTGKKDWLTEERWSKKAKDYEKIDFAKIVYCDIVLCLYLFMLKHQKKELI